MGSNDPGRTTVDEFKYFPRTLATFGANAEGCAFFPPNDYGDGRLNGVDFLRKTFGKSDEVLYFGQ